MSKASRKTASKASRTTARTGERLPARERREQLLRTAAELLRRHGTDGLELTRLAAEAGVSRPIVYRFFPSRQALIIGVLEDLEAELAARFAAVAARPFPADIGEATRLFIDAVCDAIEAKGVGPWELLGSKGPDPVVAGLARTIHERLLAPWIRNVAAALGVEVREAETVSRMLVAAARAVLEQWYTGAISRAEAVRDATRGVSGLLAAFASEGGRGMSIAAGTRGARPRAPRAMSRK
jgi:AcrR family transcriptional regulator